MGSSSLKGSSSLPLSRLENGIVDSGAENMLPNMAKKSQRTLFPRARLAGLIGKQLARRTVLTVREGHDEVLNAG